MADQTDSAAIIADGLSDTLRSWSETSGAASPGGIEPAFYLDQNSLDDLYRCNTYAQRIVDAQPDEATRRGWEITYGEQDEEEAEQGDPIGDELWRIGLREALNHGCKLARKDGLAAIYLGAWDGQTTDKLLDESKLQQITHCTLIERDQITPYAWQSDFARPGFGEPEVYQITPYSPAGSSAPLVLVHRSRLLILGGKWLPPRLQAENNSCPDSVLQRCWRLVTDFRRTEGDLGVILRSFSHGTLTLPTLGALLAGNNTAKLTERISLASASRSVFGMAVLGEGETLGYVSRSVAGLADLYDRLAQGLSATAEMPLTLLFGHAPGGLSTDDSAGRTYWYARVAAFQRNELQPHVETVGRMLALAQKGPCGGKEPEQWEINWLPLVEQSEAEKVEIRLKQAQVDEAEWRMEAISGKEIRESRHGRGAYSTETTLLEEEAPDENEPPKPGTAPSAGQE